MTVCCTLGTMAWEEEKYENIKTEAERLRCMMILLLRLLLMILLLFLLRIPDAPEVRGEAQQSRGLAWVPNVSQQH